MRNLAAFVFVAAFCVAADENASIDANQSAARSAFGYSIGIGVANLPYFDTSSKTRWRVLPYGDLRYKAFFLSPMKGIGFDLPLSGGAVFSPAISYRGGRDESDDKSLKGLGDIDAEATYGASIAYMRPNIVAGARYFRGFSSGSSSFGVLLSFPLRISENWTIAPSVSAGFADGKYNRTYYGVSKRQAAASRYDRYDPKGGLIDISLSLAVNYRVSQTTSATLFARYKRFADQAADSPIIKREGEYQNNFGAMIVYRPHK
ncbi:MAG: MipA/OmpV family protein [Helicobacteraceae bacterium]|jgi:outer membrane protein|nr:MipA/OmpV family protein [Helicobacteraceae bacterium]